MMNEKNEIKQFNMLQIILYHLLPGIPILLIAWLLSNPSCGIELPFLLSINLAIAFGLIPTELLILLITAKHQDKKMKDIISYKEKTPIIKAILWIVPLFLWLGFIFTMVPEIEQPLWTIFDWVPNWFRIDINAINTQSAMLWITIVVTFVFNGFLGPIVEELYFRGFLLPRMNKLGKLAPLINVVLFSLYHFFTPWENITRILSLLPLYYTVWYKRNIRIGMFVHCSANLVGVIGTTVALLNL